MLGFTATARSPGGSVTPLRLPHCSVFRSSSQTPSPGDPSEAVHDGGVELETASERPPLVVAWPKEIIPAQAKPRRSAVEGGKRRRIIVAHVEGLPFSGACRWGAREGDAKQVRVAGLGRGHGP